MRRIARAAAAMALRILGWRPASFALLRLPIAAWFMVASVVFAGAGILRSPAPAVFRDMVVAVVADKLAGPPVPFDFDYTRSHPLDPANTWGLYVNSEYLLEKVTLWVPQFAYEGISDGIYPEITAIQPFSGERSFVVAGTTGRLDSGYPIVLLNERFFLEGWEIDERDIYTTLLHELTHAQGGNFTFLPPPESRSAGWAYEESARLESLTSAATVEMAAAICNRGDRVACGSFWLQLRSLATGSLRAKAYRSGYGWAYKVFADLYLSNHQERVWRDKALRFWAPNMWELRGILERYSEHPWEQEVIAGVCGRVLSAGTHRLLSITAGGFSTYLVAGIRFDDTRYILGPIGTLFIRGFGCPS